MRTVLACCLLIAACGGKVDHPGVRIASVGPGLQMWCMPVSLANTLGYYKEEGVDVTLEELPSLAKAMQALMGGSVDVAAIQYLQTIQIATEGQHVRSYFIVTRRPSNVLIVAPAANQKIRRAEDLKGRLVGVSSPGSASHMTVNYYLAGHGVRPTEFSFVSIGVGAPAFAAIESGRIDAASVAGGDHFLLLRRHPGLRILADSSTPEGLRETFGGDAFAGGALSAKQEWLDRNPDTARRLARALQRTLHWTATHTPREIRARLSESFRSEDETMDLEVIQWGRDAYTTDGAMPKGAPEATRRFLSTTSDNASTAKIDLAATWTNEFLPEAK